MRNIDLTDVYHDEALIDHVVKAYREVRACRSWNPLIVPQTISYVKVIAHEAPEERRETYLDLAATDAA